MNGHQKYLFSNVLTVDGSSSAQALNPESNTSWPPERSSGDRVPASDSQGDASSQDQARASNNLDLYSSGQYIYSAPSNSFPPQSTYNSSVWFDENWPLLQYPDNWQPLNLIPPPQTAEPRGKAEPYVRRLQQQKTSVPNAIAPGSLVMPPQTINLPAQEPSPCLSGSTLSPSAPPYPASTSSMGSPNTNHKVKMEAARMGDGLLHCTHADCVNEPPVFLRRCEYT